MARGSCALPRPSTSEIASSAVNPLTRSCDPTPCGLARGPSPRSLIGGEAEAQRVSTTLEQNVETLGPLVALEDLPSDRDGPLDELIGR